MKNSCTSSIRLLHHLCLVALLSCCFPLMISAAEDGAKKEVSVCGKLLDKGNADCGSPGGKRFYFDSVVTQQCQPYYYEGCGGGLNTFDSLDECRQTCAKFVAPPGGTSPKSMVLPVPKCKGKVRAAVDGEARVLQCPENECPKGYECGEEGHCCPANKEIVCNVEHDTGKYAFQGSHTPHYFYKSDAGDCQVFTYYGALGNANNFDDYYDCIRYCKGQ